MRDAVRETVGNAFGQAVARVILTKDLVADLGDGLTETRHKTLIQLAADSSGADIAGQVTLAEMRDQLTRSIEGMLAESGQPIDVTKALAAMTPAVEGLSPVGAQIPGSRVRVPRRVWV